MIPQRKLLLLGTLTVLLAIPGTANSFTLDQLLDMPIEQLLRLQITSRQHPQLAALWPAPRSALPAPEPRDAT
ncbi:MAG: hypothetical protein ABSF96_01115 [Steroidobacteraceae bacterium]|jgi:hypothetical protein